MRKSISVAFFSTVATLMILGVAVMGLSQLVLFSRYFAQERFGALDDVGGLVSRTAGYFLKDLADGQPMTDAGVSDKVDLIGESANVHIFFTDDHGSVVLASNNDYLAVRAVPAEVMEDVAGAQEGVYHQLGKLGGALTERFYVSAQPIAFSGGPVGYVFVCASGQMLDEFVGNFGSAQ